MRSDAVLVCKSTYTEHQILKICSDILSYYIENVNCFPFDTTDDLFKETKVLLCGTYTSSATKMQNEAWHLATNAPDGACQNGGQLVMRDQFVPREV